MSRNLFFFWLLLSVFFLIRQDILLGTSVLTFIYTLFTFIYFGYLVWKQVINWKKYAVRLGICALLIIIPSFVVGGSALLGISESMKVAFYVVLIMVNLLNYRYWKTDTTIS